MEKRFVRKSGEIIWTRLGVGCVRNSDGSVDYTVAILEDITERKQAEKDRERLMAAIEQVAETIVITDAEGVIQYANPFFEQCTGYTCKEAIGQNPRISQQRRARRRLLQGDVGHPQARRSLEGANRQQEEGGHTVYRGGDNFAGAGCFRKDRQLCRRQARHYA